VERISARQKIKTGRAGIFSPSDEQHPITPRGSYQQIVSARGYRHFRISDPKPRDIHKASVCDRLLHHAIYRVLYPFFDETFIADSFSCRKDKGAHKALDRFREFSRKVSRNNTRTCWILKCDIWKFFANIDHEILLGILSRRVPDKGILWLLHEVVESFFTSNWISAFAGITNRNKVGLPLGNLTSQLFVNIYMNEFDQFVKHRLKAKHYIRYADDFAMLSQDRKWLGIILPEVAGFLRNNLNLTMHPNKVFIETMASGVEFLGWVHFPDHRVLRTATKRRMIQRIAAHPTTEMLASYVGLLKHGNAGELQRKYLPFH
jgi:RNA-directed DNA polymerase